MSMIANKIVKIFQVFTIVAALKDLNLAQMERAAMVGYISVYYGCSGTCTYLPISLPIALIECSDSNDCSHICAMVDGTLTCFCNLGYELAAGSNVQCVGMFKHTTGIM